MRKAISVCLALVLLLALAPAALADGDGAFTDVPEGAWYQSELDICVDAGLLKGKEAGRFDPDGSVTLAECVAIAARVYSLNEWDGMEFVQGEPWYQVYVDYALTKGILEEGEFAVYDVPATRRQFAGIMAHALQNASLARMSSVEDGAVPDVETGSPYYDEIYELYRAGILTGSEGGAFLPENTIARCEVAAIVARSVEPGLLRSIMLTKDGFFNCCAGGIGFNIPACFTRESADGIYGYLAAENGHTAAGLVILSQYLPVPGELFESMSGEIIRGIEESLSIEPVSEPVVTEGSTLGLPSVTMEFDAQLEGAGLMHYRVDVLMNTNSNMVVATILGYVYGCERDYMALYNEMLSTARVDESDFGSDVRPELAQIVAELYEFIADYTDLYARIQAGETITQEEMQAYEARVQELQAELDALDTGSFNEAELTLLLTVAFELASVEEEYPIPEFAEWAAQNQ